MVDQPGFKPGAGARETPGCEQHEGNGRQYRQYRPDPPQYQRQPARYEKSDPPHILPLEHVTLPASHAKHACTSLKDRIAFLGVSDTSREREAGLTEGQTGMDNNSKLAEARTIGPVVIFAIVAWVTFITILLSKLG